MIGKLVDKRVGLTLGKTYRLYPAGKDYVYVFDDNGHRAPFDLKAFELQGVAAGFKRSQNITKRKERPVEKQARLLGFRSVKDYKSVSEKAWRQHLSVRDYIKMYMTRDQEGYLGSE